MSNVLIIAEAGVNHNGDLHLAKKLIESAAKAGADYVKFQTFKAERIVTKSAQKAAYQSRHPYEKESQFAMLKKLEMPDEWHYELMQYADDKSIGFLSTGFDEESIDLLDRLGQNIFKIPSGEITNKPYLQHVARKGKEIILSTGMANVIEIRAAINVLKDEGLGNDQLTILHCNTEYPTPFEEVNLRAMITLKKLFKTKVGYSDHTLGIEAPIAAVALGAEVIEKHFTIDRRLPGPDHKASLEPEELNAMIRAARNIERAIRGDGEKKPTISESKNIAVVRKSIHLRKDVGAGARLQKEDLVMLRPGDGISPMDIDKVVGKTVKRNIKAGDKLMLTDLL